MKLPTAETVNYWKTGRSGVETWIDKAQRQVEKVGGEVYEKGNCWQAGKCAVLFSFKTADDTFRIMWPVLKTKDGRTDDPAAMIQAATYLYHDVKAKCMVALIFGVRRAFVGDMLLPNQRKTVAEWTTAELCQHMPKLLEVK